MRADTHSSSRWSTVARAASGLAGSLLLLLFVHPGIAHARATGDALSATRAQVFLNQDFDGSPPDRWERFGSSLAAGDFNGDGAQDLATGIPFDGGPTDLPLLDAGAVVVRWGVPGIGLAPAPATVLSLYAAGGQSPAHTGDVFGYALAAGNFNGDPWDDLAVGILRFDSTADDYESSGAVQIHYGQEGGIQLAGEHLVYTGPDTNAVDPPGEYDYFGMSLAVGDFEGDGYDDLAIGAPQILNFEDVDGGGAVVVLHGGIGGLLPFYGYMIHQDDPPVPDGAEDPDNFGYALATGNFNGDITFARDAWRPIDDLAISAPGEDGIGAVMVILGSSQFGGLYFVDSVYLGQGDLGGVGEANDQFGFSLVTGNFDGDYHCPFIGFVCASIDDLAIGTPYENHFEGPFESVDSGEVTVLFGAGPNNGLFAWSRTRRLVQGGGTIDVNEGGDLFGYALAAGDLDADGRADLVVGQPGEDAGRGGATVVMGGAGGFDGRRQFLTAGVNGVPPGLQNDSRFGEVLATGDFDADFCADLAIGIPHRDVGGLVDVGAETILYGDTVLLIDGFDGGGTTRWLKSPA
jgi:hypothetical protein